jgi:hypothetical protein
VIPLSSLCPPTPVPEWRQYLRFAWNALSQSVEGGWKFYVWMTLLTAVFLVGANAWAVQVRDGMALTAMSDHVSWGLYIANFTFLVGLAAGGVMMVIPAYLYHDEEMHDIVIIGELLAIAAIIMSIMFVVCDLGRPDRFWHCCPAWEVQLSRLHAHLGRHRAERLFRHQPPHLRLPALYALPRPAARGEDVCAVRVAQHRVGHQHPHRHRLPLLRTRRPAVLEHRAARPALPHASAFVSGPAFIIVAIQIIRGDRAHVR